MLSQVLTRKEQLVLLFLGGSIVFGGVVLYVVSQPTSAEPENVPRPVGQAAAAAPTRVQPAPEPAAPAQPQPPERIWVSVAGAVRSPDLYDFPGDSRVHEAIEAAGGPEEWADMRDINQAAVLIDGTTLTIPGKPERDRAVIRREEAPVPNPPQYTVSGWEPSRPVAATTGSAASASGGMADGLIDLNQASLAQLETLPGIGPKLGAEIIRFRETQPFQTVDDLDLVSGIGPKRLEAVRGMVTVSQ